MEEPHHTAPISIIPRYNSSRSGSKDSAVQEALRRLASKEKVLRPPTDRPVDPAPPPSGDAPENTWGRSRSRTLSARALRVPASELPVDRSQALSIKEEEPEEVEERREYVKQLAAIISSTRFNFFIGSMILANTVLIGLELDNDPIAEGSPVMISLAKLRNIPRVVFDAFEVLFFIVFGLEFLARIIVKGKKLLKEVSTYIDAMALTPVIMMFGFNLDASKHLTLLRIVRLLKLCRLLRLIRMFKELQVLISSITSALRALVWIGLLLLMLMYCSALWCTMLIGQNESFSEDDPIVQMYEERYGTEINIKRYWGSIMRSMFTLFQIFTLDDWNNVVRPIIETHQPLMLIFFVCFLFVTTFGLLNLLMGTIVDHAMSSAKELEAEKEKLIEEENKKVMLAAVRLFSLVDADGDGHLSAKEMSKFLQEHDLRQVLEKEMAHLKIKLDYVELMEICQAIVEEWEDPLDPSGDGITCEEFAGAAMRMQGTARSRDVLAVLVQVKTMLARLELCETSMQQLQTKVNSQAKRMEAKMDLVLALLGHDARQKTGTFGDLMTIQASTRSGHEKVGSRDRGGTSSVPRPSAPVLGRQGGAQDGDDGVVSVWSSDAGRSSPCASREKPDLFLAPTPRSPSPGEHLADPDSQCPTMSSYTEQMRAQTWQHGLIQGGAKTSGPINSAVITAACDAEEQETTVVRPKLNRSNSQSNMMNLKSERNAFSRSGQRCVGTLMQQLRNMDGWGSTQTANAFREYSTGRRSSAPEQPADRRSAHTPRASARRSSAQDQPAGASPSPQNQAVAQDGGRAGRMRSRSTHRSGPSPSPLAAITRWGRSSTEVPSSSGSCAPPGVVDS